MRNLLVFFILLIPSFSKAQITEYKASNGVTYHVNDTVKLGKGSKTDGSFLYIEDKGMPLPNPRATAHSLPKEFDNAAVI